MGEVSHEILYCPTCEKSSLPPLGAVKSNTLHALNKCCYLKAKNVDKYYIICSSLNISFFYKQPFKINSCAGLREHIIKSFLMTIDNSEYRHHTLLL